MKNWQGYVVVKKPAAMSAEELEDALHGIGVELSVESNMSNEIPHWAISPDGSEAIIEALWANDEQLTADEFARSIAKVMPKFPEQALKVALRDKVEVVAKGKGKAEGAEAARQYKEVNKDKAWKKDDRLASDEFDFGRL